MKKLDENWSRALQRETYNGYSDAPSKEALSLDLKNRLTIKQMALKYSLSSGTISKYLRLYELIQKRESKKPAREQLIKDMATLRSFVDIGKKYKVSDNAVRKWFKGYKLSMDKPVLIRKEELEKCLSSQIMRNEMAEIFGVSPKAISRLFKKYSLKFHAFRNNQYTAKRVGA
jgi:hypothetical protein